MLSLVAQSVQPTISGKFISITVLKPSCVCGGGWVILISFSRGPDWFSKLGQVNHAQSEITGFRAISTT